MVFLKNHMFKQMPLRKTSGFSNTATTGGIINTNTPVAAASIVPDSPDSKGR